MNKYNTKLGQLLSLINRSHGNQFLSEGIKKEEKMLK